MDIFSFIGIDLGQQRDYTVVTVSELDLETKEYTVPFVYKFPLKTDYTYIVSSVGRFVEKAFAEKDHVIVVDYTGVGRPVVDLFRSTGIRIVAVNITGGIKPHWEGNSFVSVPKSEIVSTLQVLFQNKRIKISSEIKIIDDIKKEFLNFNASISKKGSGTFDAASGYHDDIVMSFGIALWYAEYKTNRRKAIYIKSGS